MTLAPFLPFLSPLPLPWPNAFRRLLQWRHLSSQPHQFRSKSSPPCPSKTTASPSAPTNIQNSAQARDPPSPLPYHVHRTASQELPIYHLAKRGGNLHQTRIRKIEGNVERLREEIVKSLGIRGDLAVINRLTGHIIIKVCHYAKVLSMVCRPLRICISQTERLLMLHVGVV